MRYYTLDEPETIIDTDIGSGIPLNAIVISYGGREIDPIPCIKGIYERQRDFHLGMAKAYSNMLSEERNIN